MGKFSGGDFKLKLNGLEEIENLVDDIRRHIGSIEGLINKLRFSQMEIELSLNRPRRDSETDPNEVTD